MRSAQQLYEGVDIGGETVGLITYMRTDGVQMASEAIAAVAPRDRAAIRRGLPAATRRAITRPRPRTRRRRTRRSARPTWPARPRRSARDLDARPAPALRADLEARGRVADGNRRELDQVAVDIDRRQGRCSLRATGSIVAFDGFLKLYREDADDDAGARTRTTACCRR